MELKQISRSCVQADGQTGGRAKELTDGQTDEWGGGGRMIKRMDGRTDERKEESVDLQKDGQTDG